MQKQSLIIVGAGIAGLIAARELYEKFDVLILEAAATTGGRIRTLRIEGFPAHIEAGPEFIHGHLKETSKLLKEAGIDYEAVKGKMYRKEKEKFKEEHEFIDGWDELLKKMKGVKDDITLYDLLQLYFGTDKYKDLRQQATNYAEGFDAADVKQVSVRSLYDEWSKEEGENYRIPAGYGSLIDFLTAGCERNGVRILTNEIVKQIDWAANNIVVYTTNENRYAADKLIVTVPVSVLQTAGQTASVNFTPALDEYMNAAKRIGFGNVIKILLQFKEPFWQEDAGFIFSKEEIPTWWTQLPNTTALLTGWAGGGRADSLGVETETILLEKALQSLSNIFDRSLQELKDILIASKIFNWKKDEWALGAYNYATPETIDARKLLNIPVNDTIYFCGEALYDGPSPGTVEAAIVHAQRTAEKLILSA
jgi:monoamine oxidase